MTMKNNEMYMLIALALAGVYLLMMPKSAAPTPVQ